MTRPITIAYTPEYLDWRLGPGHPTDPVRAKRSVQELLDSDLPIRMLTPAFDAERTRRLAGEIHEPAYVAEVLAGRSGEWGGTQERLGRVASLMFTGTADLVDAVVADGLTPGVYFNPQGAKHHAHRDRSSGFCVLNDMAWAAQRFTGLDKRVLYVDWDAHHGDGVEALLRDYPGAVTASIHDGTIFPGTGLDGHDEQHGIYNWALPAGAGDEELLSAFVEVAGLFHEVRPDVVLLACGADGLAGDPLSTLQYSLGDSSRPRGGSATPRGGSATSAPRQECPCSWAERAVISRRPRPRRRGPRRSERCTPPFDSDPHRMITEQPTSARGEPR